ncbi:MAG TPA: hypothetical protein VF980_19780 [Thermoanaerobaculia bacterium]
MDELSRRRFLSLCSVLAACLPACSGITQRTRIASAFVVDPAVGDYGNTLRAVMRTVLPIGSPEFPLDINVLEERFLRMFPLEDERQFLPLQRTLTYFDHLDLAPHVAPPLVAAERIAVDVPVRTSEAEFRLQCAEKRNAESLACDAFFARFGPASHFSALDGNGQLAWLRLWAESQWSVKREFADRLRVLVCIAAYSADRMWLEIGYEGPLV